MDTSQTCTDKVEKIEVKPFAIMRQAHEAIRELTADVDSALKSHEDANFRSLWYILYEMMVFHGRMEDGVHLKSKGMFAVFNENFESVAVPLQEVHEEIDEMLLNVEEGLAMMDDSLVKSAWRKFRKANEEHLWAEEVIMMPLVCISLF